MSRATVIPKKQKRRQQIHFAFSPCRPTITSNRFSLLSGADVAEENAEPKPELKPPKKKMRKMPCFTKNQRKVLILGDSHARSCAEEVQHNFNRNFSVQGIVKPGACMKDIVSSPSNCAINNSSRNTFVIWGGARDIGKNESTWALKEVQNFVQAHPKNNIIVISAPHRYDLSQTSCVNQEVKVFNRKLRKYLKAYNNTLIVELASNRDYFTCHGLHLNRKGKDSIAKKIAAAIQDQLNTQKCAPTIMSHNPSTTTISTQDQADTATIHLK
jgi:hypothetical protein